MQAGGETLEETGLNRYLVGRRWEMFLEQGPVWSSVLGPDPSRPEEMPVVLTGKSFSANVVILAVSAWRRTVYSVKYGQSIPFSRTLPVFTLSPLVFFLWSAVGVVLEVEWQFVAVEPWSSAMVANPTNTRRILEEMVLCRRSIPSASIAKPV